MKGILFKTDFLNDSDELFEYLRDFAPWDSSMLARKTCSYGLAYNYSQMKYPYREFDKRISNVADQIEDMLDFAPNNCLINYYLNGTSKMGFLSDQTDILEENTGVAIVSLGATRILRFRSIDNP